MTDRPTGTALLDHPHRYDIADLYLALASIPETPVRARALTALERIGATMAHDEGWAALHHELSTAYLAGADRVGRIPGEPSAAPAAHRWADARTQHAACRSDVVMPAVQTATWHVLRQVLLLLDAGSLAFVRSYGSKLEVRQDAATTAITDRWRTIAAGTEDEPTTDRTDR
jgi:hypothetical protein